jgi:hypothetical protein
MIAADLQSPAPTPPAFKRAHSCRECGEAFEAGRQGALFCADPCRAAFQNRRRDRGAELYDLFMLHRCQRPTGRAIRAFFLMCRLASLWRAEDRRQRQGRPSWSPVQSVRERSARAFATVVNANAAGNRRKP